MVGSLGTVDGGRKMQQPLMEDMQGVPHGDALGESGVTIGGVSCCGRRDGLAWHSPIRARETLATAVDRRWSQVSTGDEPASCSN